MAEAAARRSASATPSPRFAPRLIIMAKSPRAGRVKQRLARSIGVTAATSFARICFAHTLLRLGASPRWRTVLAITPDTEVTAALRPRAPPGRSNACRKAAAISGAACSASSSACRLDPRSSSAAIFRPSARPRSHAPFGCSAMPMRCSDRRQDGGYWLIGLTAQPSPSRAVRRRALVEPACPCRYARQSRRAAASHWPRR